MFLQLLWKFDSDTALNFLHKKKLFPLLLSKIAEFSAIWQQGVAAGGFAVGEEHGAANLKLWGGGQAGGGGAVQGAARQVRKR